MCTRYPIINRVSELKVHIELTRFVQPEKIEIDANERAVNEKSQYCFFVCTTFDSFLNDLSILFYHISSSYFNCTFYQYSKLSFQNFLTVRKLQNCSSVILFLLCRLRNNRFTFLQNVMAGGIRGQCPSVAANKWENGTSVYIFPMLAIASIGRIFDTECI